MNHDRHVRIGAIAVQLGFLSLERYARAMLDLGSERSELAAEAFWVQRELLSVSQLLSVTQSLDALAATGDKPTLPYRDGPPVSASLLEPSPFSLIPVSAPIVGNEGLTRVVMAIPPTQPPGGPLSGPVSAPSPPSTPKLETPPASDREITMPPMPMASGEGAHDAERYTSLRVLGAGGMGQVFECIDEALGRKVAVKRLRPEVAFDPVAVAMLEREARVIGSLEHPNIIPIYDAGYRQTSGPYYAMRLLQQSSLEDILRKLRSNDQSAIAEWGLGRLLRAFIQVCKAVDYAHSHNTVHCDLKPANILLGAFGEVLVVDWGLAHSPDENLGFRGGTPGYMAPEQVGATGQIDARTDVFALGAILYEILTRQHVFPESAAASSPTYLLKRKAQHPAERAPDRNVPPDLADACMKALEVDKSNRFATAAALAEAIETFLEGTKERERRELKAADLTGQGEGLAESYHELIESRPERVVELNQLRATVATWDAPEQKQALWDAEDRQAVLDALCIRTFQSAVAAFEQALDEVPGHAGARRGLARLYLAELQRAQERRDDFDRVYFEGLLNQYDTEGKDLSRGGTLAIDVEGDPASVTLCHVQEVGRKLVTVKDEPLGETPVRVGPLPTGSYVARVSRQGFSEVVYPFVIRPGQERSFSLELRGAFDVRPGEIFVPGGPALLGGDESNLFGRDLHEVQVDPFYISAFQVSFHEYFEFVTSLIPTSPELAARYLPLSGDGVPYFEYHAGEFVPARITEWESDVEDFSSLPVFGIDLECAQAYARWKSESTGRAYRLPNEYEWEKAARGVDGRRFPWGDKFDASFCKMRESRAGLPFPEPSGVFADDVSPYGVRDMAGGLAEWVLPPPQEAADEGLQTQVAARGGAWCDWRVDCNLAARRPYFIGERSARVGFRLARSLRGA